MKDMDGDTDAVNLKSVGGGKYEGAAEFVMAGTWHVVVSIKEAGYKDQVVYGLGVKE